MSKKRKIIEEGVEQQSAYYQNKYDAEHSADLAKKNDPAKPNLLKRFASILLDGLMIGVVLAALYAVSYLFVFPSLGYQSAIKESRQIYVSSGLYVETADGTISTLTDTYDNTKTAGENYDGPITHYYTVDARAIENDMYESYCDAKIRSNYFERDSEGNIVEKVGITHTDFKAFYEGQYNAAVSFLKKDPTIVANSNKTLLIAVVSMAICSLVATSIFYLLIPLLRKEGETLGQMICKLSCVNAEDKKAPTKGQLVVRFVVVFLTTYMLPLSLYILWSWAFGLPVFVNAAMIAFKRDNTSFHDFFSKTKIINKSRSDAFAILDAVKGNNPQ